MNEMQVDERHAYLRFLRNTLGKQHAVFNPTTQPDMQITDADYAELAEIVIGADQIIRYLRVQDAEDEDVRAVIAELVAARTKAFWLMARHNPDQAWFWTEEWQAKIHEADLDQAAGRSTRYTSEEEFEASLAALDSDLDRHAHVRN